ncbi:MAG: efflux RND transporter permease subunit [Bdellovibrionaceae bacterium]|nr:efflux RND transporter permease subunit [Pseudobdellovibrionaceae bacterium]
MNIIDLSVKRPIFMICLVTALLVGGYVSLKSMPVDTFPDVTFPVVAISVAYPGASPVDLEREVSKKIEDEISSLAGLETLTSNNYEGMAVVIAQFLLETDIKDVEQQIRNRVGNIRADLPVDIQEPVIRRMDPADQPILFLTVSSKMPVGELYDVVDERVKPLFERIADVGQVQIFGGRKNEVRVYVDKDKLERRELSMLAVAQRIAETSKDVPVGKFDSAISETSLRTNGAFQSFEDLKNVTVSFVGSDRAVKLHEVADVKMDLEDATTTATMNGETALILAIYKQSGANTLQVANRAIERIGEVNKLMKERNLDVNLEMARDGSVPIRMNVADVFETIVIGIILCVLVVFFFLGSLRSTFITATALPTSLLGGFILMYVSGFSINILTLLALSLAIGLLIDDAIVVRENIFRHMEMGKPPVQAALDGAKEVGLAVVATTLVVMAVFAPIAFVPGMIGQFLKQFGLTVVFTMAISLFDAFTMGPMLSAYLASPNEHVKGTGLIARMLAAFDRFQTRLEELYESSLKWVIGHRLTVLTMAAVIFFSSLGLVAFISKTFLPQSELGEFTISVELPVGSSLERTDQFTREVEQEIRQFPEVRLAMKTVGSQMMESNKASFFVSLVPSKERKLSTEGVKQKTREILKKYSKDAIFAVSDIDAVGGGQKPFNLFIVGDDLDLLTQYAEKVRDRTAQIKHFADVDMNFRSGKPEFRVNFDRVRSEALGVSTATAGMELRYRVEGAETAIYRQNGIEYDVRVRLKEDQRDLRSNFDTTLVPNQNGNMIRLSRIATPEDAKGVSQINRQNKGRYIAITANMSPGGSIGDGTAEIEKALAGDLKPPAGIEFRFDGQAKEFGKLMVNMVIAMGLGVLLIYLVLASLYESFVTPLTILLALPLGISGALVALFVFGKTLDLFSMIGMVMLLGVVAKNSILLVDYTKQLMREGLEENEALLKACRIRLRPILMTSFALIAGMLPIAIGLSEIGSQRMSMGIGIIGGILSSTFLTLLAVPAAFGYVERVDRALIRLFNRFRGLNPDGSSKSAHGHH